MHPYKAISLRLKSRFHIGSSLPKGTIRLSCRLVKQKERACNTFSPFSLSKATIS